MAEGVPRDMDKAMALYKKASTPDRSSTATTWATPCAGQLFTRDPKQGALRLKQGCDGGVAASCYELGLMHEVGDGVARDPGRAAVLFTQACTAGEARACAKAKAYGR